MEHTSKFSPDIEPLSPDVIDMEEQYQLEKDQSETRDALVATLEQYGAEVRKDEFNTIAYQISFAFAEGAKSHIRILLGDASGMDIVITNLTTLPKEAMGQGYASTAVQNLVRWASEHGMQTIMASQIGEHNAGFWIKNDFKKMPEPNPCNDYLREV